MKAVAVNPSTRRVRLLDHEEPRITSPTQVKLRMLDVGVCGTDREICSFEYGTPPAGSTHLVIGHESLGVVEEIGSAVSRLSAGDLVVPIVRRPCRHQTCAACRSGRQDFCYTGEFQERGIKEAHGFMTESIVDDEIYMNPVPRELRKFAVLVEPLTIAEKALMQVREIQQRLPWMCSGPVPQCRKAVVLGAGPVGLLGAMALVNAGFETFVYSRSRRPNSKATLAESFGARYVSSEEESLDQLASRMGNIDLVYEAVGASRAAFEMMSVLGTNGVFVFTGVPGRKAPVEIDTDLLMRNLVLKNQVVFGTVNAGRGAYEAAIEDLGIFVKRWPKAVAGLITGRHPVDAYEELLLGKATGIKNVIAFSEAV
ncbi:MAG TPA: glucose 1-dehydrogenase [Candidatus Polarisedimenticolia bacterium]|nr:glucose 1-dehydrogenase [Candidatus Polarisedimenticolia bacterium]